MSTTIIGDGDKSRRAVVRPTAMLDKHVRARRADGRDLDVGRRVRSRRLECGLSQTDLADRIGVTFQQVQKYEKGTNRIGAGRLQRISEALKVPITFFFGNQTLNALPSETKAANQMSNVFALAQTGKSVRLMTAFSKIRSKKQQQLIVEMAEEMAEK